MGTPGLGEHGLGKQSSLDNTKLECRAGKTNLKRQRLDRASPAAPSTHAARPGALGRAAAAVNLSVDVGDFCKRRDELHT